MAWRLNVDRTLCGATGMCQALAPELFELNEAYAQPVRPEIEPAELALDAADQCPTQAITVWDGGEEIGPRP